MTTQPRKTTRSRSSTRSGRGRQSAASRANTAPATPVLETAPPAGNIPAGNIPASSIPAADIPTVDIPAADVLALDTPAANAPTADVPAASIGDANSPPLLMPMSASAEPGRTGGYLAVESRRAERLVPTPGGLARRRWMINTSKFVLPAAAVLLLASVILWPEFNKATDAARVVMTGFRAAMDGARITNAHYRGVDDRGRPFTVTAATAVQRDVEQIDLTSPNGDMTLENGSWIDVKSRFGVFTRKAQQLDLYDDVVMYRDNGTTMTTSSATVEMKAGAASSAAPTHVEGPFGTLDAAGFTTVDKGAAIQFWGPARVVLNGVSK
jgi:lipopolysaccharide export system protein LptC